MSRTLSASILALALAALPAAAQTTAPAGDAATPADTTAQGGEAAAAPQSDAAAGEATATNPGDDAASGEAASGDPSASGDAASDTAAGLEPAEPDGTFVFDPEHSHVVWSYEHMGFSTSTGVVNGVTGTVTLDKDNPAASTVEASFPLASLKTVSTLLDEHLLGADFFDGDAPDTAITFRSTTVEPTGDMTARVSGDLEMNGMTQPLTLDVTLRQTAVDPISKLPTAGFQATGTLLRSDFGLGAFAPAVGDEIDLVINVEAKKGG